MHVPVGIFKTNAAGECIYVNRRLCEMFGLSRKQALGLGWTKAIHPEDRERVLTLRQNAIGSIRSFELQYRVQVTGKGTLWVAASSTALLDKAGNFRGRIGIILDITSQKSAGPPTAAATQTIQSGPSQSSRAADNPDRDRKFALSQQEWRILTLVVEGKTNKEIAATLALSEKTVKNYLSNAFQKLNVKRRSQAAVFFARFLEASEKTRDVASNLTT